MTGLAHRLFCFGAAPLPIVVRIAATTLVVTPTFVRAQTVLPEVTIATRQDDSQAARDQRERVLPKTGANSYPINKAAIDALPQGDVTTIDRVLLQAPDVSQGSAASGDLHIRNEHANLQDRLDGIVLPAVVNYGALFKGRDLLIAHESPHLLGATRYSASRLDGVIQVIRNRSHFKKLERVRAGKVIRLFRNRL